MSAPRSVKEVVLQLSLAEFQTVIHMKANRSWSTPGTKLPFKEGTWRGVVAKPAGVKFFGQNDGKEVEMGMAKALDFDDAATGPQSAEFLLTALPDAGTWTVVTINDD